MKVKYVGNYEGNVPWCNLAVKPGDIKDVPDDIGKQLLTTGQFEEIKPQFEVKEVKEIAKTSSDSR